MATPNLQIQNINSLEDQGKALAASFAVIEKADAKNFKLSLRVDEAKPLVLLREQWTRLISLL